MALVWGEVPPAFSIGHDTPLGSWDSGFTVLFDDAPEPDEVDDVNDHPGISLVCLRCLLDDHPKIGRGLDLAREHGAAELDLDGEWVAGTVRRRRAGLSAAARVSALLAAAFTMAGVCDDISGGQDRGEGAGADD